MSPRYCHVEHRGAEKRCLGTGYFAHMIALANDYTHKGANVPAQNTVTVGFGGRLDTLACRPRAVPPGEPACERASRDGRREEHTDDTEHRQQPADQTHRNSASRARVVEHLTDRDHHRGQSPEGRETG